MSSEYNPEAEARVLNDRYHLGDEPLVDLAAAALRAAYERGLEDSAKVADDVAITARLEGVPQPGALSAAVRIRALAAKGGPHGA
jgi:hypothetical protein